MNKNVYPKITDEKLLGLVSGFKYVPYRLNKHSKHEVGHMYYNGYHQEIYTVLEITDEGKTKVEWENGRVSLHRSKLDIKKDYELMPFEFDGGKVINSNNKSYSAAEIKALIYTNMITDEEVIKVLMEYFTATHVPNDYNYYFIRTPKVEGVRQIKLKRDLKRCPHNFYNIKTVEDLYKDSRISLYEFVDRDGLEVIPDKDNDKVIPSWTPVLLIDHIAGAKYRIKLDMYQRNGNTYARWMNGFYDKNNMKAYISETVPTTRHNTLFKDEKNGDEMFW